MSRRRLVEDQLRRRSVGSSGPQHAAQRGEEVAARANAVGAQRTLPASSCERSSRSLTSSSSASAERRMKPTCFSCSAVSGAVGAASSSSVRPRMELSGVRNSWLTLATTRVLISAERLSESVLSSSSGGARGPPWFDSSNSRLLSASRPAVRATSCFCRAISRFRATMSLIVACTWDIASTY